MLQLKDVRKTFTAGDLRQVALDGVTLSLRDSEFVAVLGPSGSGKSTLLNVTGGLERYDSGDLVVDGVSTRSYTDRDWDSYRNHDVGFVFQSYNLIAHQTVLANVELSLSIAGVSRSERRERARRALESVGLGDQVGKKPNQLSGGQMQRVAIARALVNDPRVLLADEPTGALDSETSNQVMDLLKQVARDRLVVMVTHDAALAERYATRIVRLEDGRVTADSDPFDPASAPAVASESGSGAASATGSGPAAAESDPVAALDAPAPTTGGGRGPSGRSGRRKGAAMPFRSSLALSFANLRTKRARTLLTSFAASIGIIGIALILSLSNGVNTYIADVQRSTMLSYPVTIESQSLDMNAILQAADSPLGAAAGRPASTAGSGSGSGEGEGEAVEGVRVDTSGLQRTSTMASAVVYNNLAPFKAYLDAERCELRDYVGANGIVYSYDVQFDVYARDPEGELVNARASFSQLLSGGEGSLTSPVLTDAYEVVYGSWPTSYDEVVLVVGEDGSLDASTLRWLGFVSSAEYDAAARAAEAGSEPTLSVSSLSYEDVCAKEFTLVSPCDMYVRNGDGTFDRRGDDEASLEEALREGVTLRVSGVVQPTGDAAGAQINGAVGYTEALVERLIDRTDASAVVAAQLADPSVNVLNGVSFSATGDAQKAEEVRSYLAGLDASEKAEFLGGLFENQDLLDRLMQTPAAYASLLGGYAGSGGLFSSSGEMSSSGELSSSKELSAQAGGVLSQLGGLSGQEGDAGALESLLGGLDDSVLAAVYDVCLAGGSYEENMAAFGFVDRDEPSSISIYADTFEDKDAIVSCIDDYNATAGEGDRIVYTDYVGLLMSSVTTIVNVISYILVAFVAVSLVVSSIMIGVITYISVLERTREIGVLRALGASKRNVSQVFDAETFIVGLCSGLMGVGIALVLLVPCNVVIAVLADTTAVRASLPPVTAAVLIALSVLLTLLGGLIPARAAARKDPVAALRAE